MGVLLHANYRLRGPNGQKIVMPAPIDKDTPHAPWWWDHLAGQAADFRRCGFSAGRPVTETLQSVGKEYSS